MAAAKHKCHSWHRSLLSYQDGARRADSDGRATARRGTGRLHNVTREEEKKRHVSRNSSLRCP